MPQTFRLSFDITSEADPSDLLERLIQFQQEFVEPDEGEDAEEDTCSVEHITIKGGE